MIFAKMKIGPKMGLVFGFILFMLALTIFLGISSTGKVKGSLEGIVEGEYRKTVSALAAMESLDQLMIGMQSLVLVNSQSAAEQQKTAIEKARSEYRENLKNLEALEKDPQGIKLIEESKAAASAAAQANNRVIELALADKKAEALSLLLSQAGPLTKKAQSTFDAQVHFQEANVKVAYDKAVSLYKTQRLILLISGALAFLLGLAGAIFLTHNFVTRLNRVAASMDKVAAGDLSTKLKIFAKDEIGELGHAINRMLDSVHGVVSTIKITAEQVAAASTQLSQTAEQMATGAEEVACQAGTVAVASEEMSATSNDIAQNCHLSAESASQVTDTTRKGFAVVQHTVNGIRNRGERTKENARMIASLGERSDQIGAIVSTIEDIADQTNLLALNAAIEAARAGEQGRGFAVVADEVRALAERTTKATKEISEMIRSIQNETKVAIVSMEEGVRGTEVGAQDAAQLETSLQEILDQVNSVTMQISQIATAAEQQTSTTSEITNNIQQITEVVSETAKGSQESAAAATRLSHLAEELQRAVEMFRLAS
jgi:methyl-accepting chemotaxis protein